MPLGCLWDMNNLDRMNRKSYTFNCAFELAPVDNDSEATCRVFDHP